MKYVKYSLRLLCFLSYGKVMIKPRTSLFIISRPAVDAIIGKTRRLKMLNNKRYHIFRLVQTRFPPQYSNGTGFPGSLADDVEKWDPREKRASTKNSGSSHHCHKFRTNVCTSKYEYSNVHTYETEEVLYTHIVFLLFFLLSFLCRCPQPVTRNHSRPIHKPADVNLPVQARTSLDVPE